MCGSEGVFGNTGCQYVHARIEPNDRFKLPSLLLIRGALSRLHALVFSGRCWKKAAIESFKASAAAKAVVLFYTWRRADASG